jgi:HD superfamily phosphodiesterase
MFDKYKSIYDLAKPYLQTRQNDVHIDICYEFACRLLEEEPGDPEIVLPAVICHDLGWIMLSEELQLKAFGPVFDPELRRIHEVEGVKLARQILLKVGYDSKKTIEILDIIDGHDSRSLALSDSDRIVKDADKLFRYEPRGRAIDTERFSIESSEHIHWLGCQIEPWFFTETAKRFARAELER